MKFTNTDTRLHVRGESVFLDDMNEPGNLLHAAIFYSQVAHGRIIRLDVSQAKAQPGVFSVLTAEDIPGENQIGGIIPDEALLAEGSVHFVGEPVAIVLADTRWQAKAALKHIVFEVEQLPVITDPREAYAKGELIAPERTFAMGDVECAWDKCDLVFEGRAESGGQEHFYLETQCAQVEPLENGHVKVYSSTQSPTVVQKAAARVLGLGQHYVEVEVRRMGGAFGGKEDQATPWACLAAVPAYVLQRPVRLVLERHDDILITGKRHPYSSDYKIGLSRDGKILAFEAMYYQNAGAVADLSTSILERTLFHGTNSYFVPNVHITAASCRTNLPPFTAFRGFGGPQGMFVIEAAIQEAAIRLGKSPREIQEINLLEEGDEFSYGMFVHQARAKRSWQELKEQYQIEKLYSEVDKFNQENAMQKKGLALMPICFGISFTTIFLNQAAALVHVYQDGTVSVSTGVTEMGQGVNMKIAKIVADTFSIDPDLVKIETTNTTRCANTSPTAASSGADMNGKAAQIACYQIIKRLKASAAALLHHNDSEVIQLKDGKVWCEGRETDLDWKTLVIKSYLSRVDLSAHGHFAVPNLHFDKTKEKGNPFAYHVFGTAAVEVTLDCLRGTYEVDRVMIAHDMGRSIDEKIDRGQVHGALMQGIGWVTMEELTYAEDGRPLIDTASKYKVPDIKFTPQVDMHFLADADNQYAVANSKAVGEPPFMYGIGAYFAIAEAMRAFRPDKELLVDAPLTTEKVLRYLYD